MKGGFTLYKYYPIFDIKFTAMKSDSLIFGIYPVEEALQTSNLDKLFVQNGNTNEKINRIVKNAEQKNITIQFVPIEKLNRLVKGNHQGIIAQSAPISFTSIEKVVADAFKSNVAPLFLILDQLSDVRNFGAIVRTAECTGVNAIIIPKSGAAPITGDTVKTSAGAIYKIPICKTDHIKDAIFYLQGSGVRVLAATEKTNTSLYTLDLKEPLALIMGSEGKGISNSVLNLTDDKASLPLLGEINSLNVSVACGAFLYEIVRQRHH